MDFNTLKTFRQHFYELLERARDSLFNCADALLTETSAHSFIELSLSPFFERKWPSLYEAFEDGSLPQDQLRPLFASYAPYNEADDDWLVVGVDACNIARPFSHTASDRGCLYLHNLPECDKPITYGWQFSVVGVLPEPVSSWCYLLDTKRITTEQTAAEVAAEQLAALSQLVARRLLVVADRYYGSLAFIGALLARAAKLDALLRIKRDRVFYRDPPPHQGKRGAPRKDGARFKCNDPTTHGEPDRIFETTDERGNKLEVVAWDKLHFRQERTTKVSVIRVRQHTASDKAKVSESWYIWWGQKPLALERVVPFYRRRFSLEHTFRFKKQDLLWDKARLGSPEQIELWSKLVAFVVNQLVLAQALQAEYRRGWESQSRAASPQQVRRGMAAILGKLGTPAGPVKGRGKSPGRVKGGRVSPRQRHGVVKKGAKKALPLALSG